MVFFLGLHRSGRRAAVPIPTQAEIARAYSAHNMVAGWGGRGGIAHFLCGLWVRDDLGVDRGGEMGGLGGRGTL
jgi:hypothetical protein